jgi:hypothetical protein
MFHKIILQVEKMSSSGISRGSCVQYLKEILKDENYVCRHMLDIEQVFYEV